MKLINRILSFSPIFSLKQLHWHLSFPTNTISITHITTAVDLQFFSNELISVSPPLPLRPSSTGTWFCSFHSNCETFLTRWDHFWIIATIFTWKMHCFDWRKYFSRSASFKPPHGASIPHLRLPRFTISCWNLFWHRQTNTISHSSPHLINILWPWCKICFIFFSQNYTWRSLSHQIQWFSGDWIFNPRQFSSIVLSQ